MIPWRNPGVRNELRYIKKHLKLAYYKWRKSFSKVPENVSSDRLHIGCGSSVKQGWINVDLFPSEGAYFVDASIGLPFAESSFQHIHCEHFLEHLEQEQAVRFLQECFRVLRPGGSFRIIVPDAGKYFYAYTADDREFFRKLENLGGAKDPMVTPCEVINRMFRMWGDHRFAWDYPTLSFYLAKAGFSEIILSGHHDVPVEYDIDGVEWWRVVESLYINAEKS